MKLQGEFMETTNYIIQGVIGFLISLPIILVVCNRIRKINQLNQSAKSHLDIWKDLQKNKGELR